MKKRKFLFCLAALLALALCAGIVAGRNAPAKENTATGAEAGFVIGDKPDGTVQVFGYSGTYEGSDLVIPAEVNGRTVSEVAQSAFRQFGGGKIEKITLPATVKVIGHSAFSGMTGLKTIDFGAASTLEIIGDEAFAGCTALQSVTLPASVQDFTASVFTGCTSLTSVQIDNDHYTSADGVVYVQDKSSLVYYPEGKSDVSYTVDAACKEIDASAFAGNTHLQSLFLNNVEVIRQYGMAGCTNLQTISAEKLEIAAAGAFSQTKWLQENANESIVLGNVLVAYRGTAGEVMIENVKTIAPYAFADNKTITSVTIGDGVVSIGEKAFCGCENLKNVYFAGADSLVYISDYTFDENAEGRKIYVPHTLQSEYLSNEIWQQYENDIAVHQTEILFDAQGGSACPNGSVYYQDYLTLPVPAKEGYTFKGWYDNAAREGTPYNEQTPWNSLADNVTFYADWQARSYPAVLQTKGGTVTPDLLYFTIEESKVLPDPVREGYKFEGWYENEDYSGSPVTEIPVGSVGDRRYYAKWDANNYMVTLSMGYEGAPDRTEYVEYGKICTLTIPVREGYTFAGWSYNGVLYTGPDGVLVKPWDLAEEVTLVAVWDVQVPQ